MALNKQNKANAAAHKVMTFGENRDLGKIMSASDEIALKRVNFNVPEDKHQRLKMACVRKGVSISDVMSGLIDGWLKENE